jgi:hypothetical protein
VSAAKPTLLPSGNDGEVFGVVDEFVTIAEEISEMTMPAPEDERWVQRATAALEEALRVAVAGASAVMERARERLREEIDEVERDAGLRSARCDALRLAIRDAKRLAALIGSISGAGSQNEEHRLAEDAGRLRQDLTTRLEAYRSASLFLPSGGPREIEERSWVRVANQLSETLAEEEGEVAACVVRLQTLRESNLFRSVLLEQAIRLESAAVSMASQNHVEPCSGSSDVPVSGKTPVLRGHGRDGATCEAAVMAALRSAGGDGISTTEILAHLRMNDHSLSRRRKPLQSIHVEIYKLRQRDPASIRVTKRGREVRYHLLPGDGAGINPRKGTEMASSASRVGSTRLPKLIVNRLAGKEEAVLAAISATGREGCRLIDIVNVLKRSRHPLARGANPRSAVYFQISKIKNRRPRPIVCTRLGREVVYKMK